MWTPIYTQADLNNIWRHRTTLSHPGFVHPLIYAVNKSQLDVSPTASRRQNPSRPKTPDVYILPTGTSTEDGAVPNFINIRSWLTNKTWEQIRLYIHAFIHTWTVGTDVIFKTGICTGNSLSQAHCFKPHQGQYITYIPNHSRKYLFDQLINRLSGLQV
jgi:hypothetical protein